ncbi:UDP-N-acetylglucosamine:LPS N-acetylglucosamine transferase [Prauserella shujinwangii]|uniref:UDP-N-acetylglucosamine:LPS N-acetylglucosamine transferase n=1 Tax=Prauserella shujinwangii TaxID=1453103 RepID=A0A2T0LSE2_9PSEU|nr:glycosyltransferase [Prauserella shujinwangii]PRX46578.1 UDP-N-acetylglucosamine:LPS N-acetylglucosamine transferase [Prauserella shujinwangii]
MGYRVLILTAAMGGGHVQVSRELARRLTDRGHEVVLADLNDLMPAGTGNWLGRFYPWLVNRAPWLYDLIYRRYFLHERARRRVAPTVRLALPGLRRLVGEVRPDVTVSTYHLASLCLGQLREQGTLPTPAVSFVTTFSVHGLWLHPANDAELCISPSAAADAERRTGRAAGVCGPVVREAFSAPRGDPAPVRDELGVPADARIALVVGGSFGFGSVERAVTALADDPGWFPVVVCGRNERLRQRLRRRLGRGAVLGWVEDMPRLTGAADLVVENAGGLSAKEALCRGVPVVTFRPIPGHGRDDAEALARLGLTDLADDTAELLAAARRLTTDRALRRDRIARGQALFEQDAADLVTREAERHTRVPAA